jgi:YggT family protein
VQIVGYIIGLVLEIFLIVLFARMILSWVYSLTDPPLRALRKVLKPVRVGAMSLDLAFIALFLLVSILMQINRVVFYY